jgi:hypothetical protein
VCRWYGGGGGCRVGDLSIAALPTLFSGGDKKRIFFLLQKTIFYNSFVPTKVLNHYTAEIYKESGSI